MKKDQIERPYTMEGSMVGVPTVWDSMPAWIRWPAAIGVIVFFIGAFAAPFLLAR